MFPRVVNQSASQTRSRTRSAVVAEPVAFIEFIRTVLIIIVAAAAFVLAAGVLYQIIGSRLDEHRYPAPGVMIEVEEQRLHVRCEGDGNPVVLFESGIAASSLISWARVLGQVAAFTRACAYNRAGLGWSPPPRHRRTVPRMLRRAARGPGLCGPGRTRRSGWPFLRRVSRLHVRGGVPRRRRRADSDRSAKRVARTDPATEAVAVGWLW